jgi:hypothetical protein
MQSKFTITTQFILKSRVRGERKASLLLHFECKSGEKTDGVPVSSLPLKFSAHKFANWPNSAGIGPGYTKLSQNIQKPTLSDCKDRAYAKQASSFILNIAKENNEDGVPVS